MSAKKSAKGETKPNDNWRKILESAKISDVDFKFQAIVMEGAGNDQDQLYLSKFEAAALDEKRCVIKNITKTETIFMVNQLGTEKKERDESLKVFEEAYEAMKTNENKKELPPEILARLIKYQMIEIKKKYLIVQKEKRELKEGMKLESATMIDQFEVKGAIVQPPAPIEPPKQTKKGKKEPLEDTIEPKEGKKYNTSLRERGEEWRDKTYVNDFPIDGPNVYVVITGFSEPLLISGLMRIGIPLAAVVQVRIDPLNTTVPLSLMRTSKRGQNQSEVLSEHALRFWYQVQNLRIQPDIAHEYKDVAFIAFKPPYCEGDKLKGDADSIYDDISFLLYDIQDLNRQHDNYLENMNVVHIPEETQNINYFNRYTEMADQIPNECTTVFFVLNNILNAIDEPQDSTSKTNSPSTISKTATPSPNAMPTVGLRDANRIEKTQMLVEEVFHALQTTYEEKQKKVSYRENEYVFQDPVVIDYGDYFSSNSFHFENSFDIEIIINMLKGMPLCCMWDTVTKPSGDQKAKINYHLKVLMHSFGTDTIEYSKLYRLLNVLAFRKLFDNRNSSINTNFTQIKLDDFKKTYLKRSIFSEPLQKANSFSHISSRTEASSTHSSISMTEMSLNKSNSTVETEDNCISNENLFECPDIGDLISASEITSKKVDEHVIDGFEYFEDFDMKCTVQVLHHVFSEFNCVDYKLCRVTDSILLLGYNNHNNGILTKEWKTNLTTPVCMQDFFDFVLYEHYEWFQNEEIAYEDMMKNYYQMENVDDLGSASNRSCLEKSVLELDMMVEGSLKYDEFVKLQTNSTVPSETTISIKKGKNKTVTPSSTNMTTSSKKSSKSAKTSTLGSYKGSSVDSKTSLEEIKVKPFLGYDINNRRIEIFGRDASFFSEDGTKVFTKYFTEFPQCQEYVTLQVMSGKDTEICVHKPLGDYTKPILHETVRILTKNNVQLHLQKESYEDIPIINESLIEDFEKRKNKQGLDNLNAENDPVLIYFYSLVISTNNGLLIECIHDEKSLSVLYIRQHYLIESEFVKDEEMRCISKSGEVVIFKKSGDIEILCPDSSYIVCTKYERKIIDTDSIIGEPAPSVTTDSSNKNKKDSKVKDTKKSGKKSNKSVSLPSVVEREVKKEIIYELEFQEFCVIEADGKKKYFCNENFEEAEVLLIRTATDFNLGEVFSRRMDGTNLLYNHEGLLTVTFPNGTRIISSFYIDNEDVFPEWSEEEKIIFEIQDDLQFDGKGNVDQFSCENGSTNDIKQSSIDKSKDNYEGYALIHLTFTIEHMNYATVTIDTGTQEFTVDTQNSVSVTVTDQAEYIMNLDQMTTITFNSDRLHLEYISCPESDCKTLCDINVSTSDNLEQNYSAQSFWLHLKDSYGKDVSVNYEGVLKLNEKDIPKTDSQGEQIENGSIQSNVEELEECIPCDKCRESHFVNQFRFFVLHKDLSVSELVHKLFIDNYKRNCNSKDWGSANNYNVFGDNRELLSILYPISYNESEKWLMNSKFIAKPQNMVFKDLKSGEGKGFYKWMRPYERFKTTPRLPPPAVAPGPPKAFILRTLERQWRNCSREMLKGGRELIRAIIKYRRTMEEDKETMTGDPIRDPRDEGDIIQYQLVQDLAQRTIDKMQKKIEMLKQADGEENSKPLEFIRIPLERDNQNSELQDENTSSSKRLTESSKSSTNTAEEEENLVKELEVIEEMRPQLQRYWRHRAEKERQNQYYKEVLRHAYVPPYFDNMLVGGAAWWEVNRAVEAAMDQSETSKKKTVCYCCDDDVSDDSNNNSTDIQEDK